MYIMQDSLLATAVGFVMTTEFAWFFSIGDGKVFLNGEEIDSHTFESREWEGNPLNRAVSVDYRTKEKDEDGDEYEDWNNIRFSPSELKKIDGNGTKYVFTNETGASLILTKVKEKTYSYYDMI
jgi:hypothetical protein